MNSIEFIRDLLHNVAGLFIWPVLICLLLLAATTVVWLGHFAREALDRRRSKFRSLRADMSRLDEIAVHARGVDLELQLEQALGEANHRRWVSLHRSRILVRLGPSLGLMGTLIPMAAALAALSSGNLPSLARNMVTAFAATVIGLAISVVTYVMASFREEWVRRDGQALALHAEGLLNGDHANTREAGVAFR